MRAEPNHIVISAQQMWNKTMQRNGCRQTPASPGSVLKQNQARGAFPTLCSMWGQLPSSTLLTRVTLTTSPSPAHSCRQPCWGSTGTSLTNNSPRWLFSASALANRAEQQLKAVPFPHPAGVHLNPLAPAERGGRCMGDPQHDNGALLQAGQFQVQGLKWDSFRGVRYLANWQQRSALCSCKQRKRRSLTAPHQAWSLPAEGGGCLHSTRRCRAGAFFCPWATQGKWVYLITVWKGVNCRVQEIC